MQNILAVTPLLGRSGSEIALVNLLGSLSAGFQITIYTPTTNPDLELELPTKVKLVTPQKKSKWNSGFEKAFQKLRSFPILNDLDRLINRENFDVIILNTLLTVKYYSGLQKRGKKIILYIHETEAMLVGLNSDKFREALYGVDLILCSSNYIMNYVKLFARNEAIKVLYPSLDFSKIHLPVSSKKIRDLLGFSDNEFIWGMCGATTINKNPKMFIEVAKRVLSKNNDARFLWIGTRGKDAYEEYLKKEVEDAGLQEAIRFLGKKTTDYYQFINTLDGFVLTSLSESFSLAALEAASFNKPVVSFPCGGILESVPENLRWVTTEFSIEELAGLMEVIMTKKISPLGLKDAELLLENHRTFASLKFEKHLQEFLI